MKNPVHIKNEIYWLGVNDRETDLFEALWPIPRGVAYNSYIIKDEKCVLIDTVKATYQTEYINKIQTLIGNDKKIDYLVINHMEPDHSGAITMLRNIYPDMKIIGNEKTLDYLNGFYKISDNTQAVKDGEELDIGSRKLKFFITPMVHWPETMMTLDQSVGMLFSGDAFGGFGTLDGGIFDDEVNMNFYSEETLRYYSNIVGKYAPMAHRAIQRLRELDVKIIGSTHGPVLRKNPWKVIDDYDRWSSYTTEKGAVIAYASMYGNTKVLAEAIARSLAENGIEQVKLFDVSRQHISYAIANIWRYRGLILGSCTYNTKIFPLMEQLLTFFENSNIKNHLLGLFGSYTWSGGAVTRLKQFSENSKIETLEPVIEIKHSATAEDLEKCNELGKNMATALHQAH